LSAADVVVVGGGPAGMHAALAAAEHGVHVTLIDEGTDLGGQTYRAPTRRADGVSPDPRGARLREAVVRYGDRIDVRRGAVVWGLFDGPTVAISADGRSELLAARQVVLAPGAHELVAPFPGWTLPGVMTPGAGQILVKSMGIAPGENVLIAGTGPFLLTAACALLAAGVGVSAVLEASPRAPWLRIPLRAYRSPLVLWQGLRYLATLARHRVPVRYGRMVVRATGNTQLETVHHAPVDREWRPDRTREESAAVDTLLIAYGFVPRADLAQSAGCRVSLHEPSGAWVPERDRDLATSLPGVLSAGDGAGVAGVLVAAAEGRLAGLVAAARVGALATDRLRVLRRPLERRLRRLASLRIALDEISAVGPGLAEIAEPDTIVCRCEEITRREVEDAVGHGCTTHPSLRVATRIAMGACQGRMCWPSIARMVSQRRGVTLAAVGARSVRPPVRPVTLGALANGASGE